MTFSREKQGDLIILSESILWGLFPVITVLSYHNLSPIVSLIISSLFAALFFSIVITIRKSWHELLNLSAYKNILYYALLNGVIYYLLIYFALKFTSAGNVAIVSLAEVGFSFFFFNVLGKDHIPINHLLGAACMIIGAFIVLIPNFTSFKIGDILVLIGTSILPLGSLFAQKARKLISSESIMLVRSAISVGVISVLALSIHTSVSVPAIKESLIFLMINGFLSLGLARVLWIDGIHRISITKASALSSIAPFYTLIFAWMFLKQSPTIWQLSSLLPICVGIILLSKGKTNLPKVSEVN